MSVALLAALFCIACYGLGFVVGRWYGGVRLRQRLASPPTWTTVVYSSPFADDSPRALRYRVTAQDSTGDDRF